MRRGQIQDRAGAGAHRPDAHINGTVPQGVGVFGKGKTTVLVAVRSDAQGLHYRLGHEIGAAARATRADIAALDLLDIGNVAALERHDLE